MKTDTVSFLQKKLEYFMLLLSLSRNNLFQVSQEMNNNI